MYQDNAGNIFENYAAACNYYGIETPEQLAAEARYEAQDWFIQVQDDIEAYGPQVSFDDFDDFPF